MVGPEAGQIPEDESNLITRQARALGVAADVDCRLHKELPVSSGIGGGSADAAAYYRGIAALSEVDFGSQLASPDRISAQWTIGADIPMCIASRPARISGIGEVVTPVSGLPEWPIVLVNPRVPVPTAEVFRDLHRRDNPPMEPLPATAHLSWLAAQRNDLQSPAILRAPVIATVLAALSDQADCMLARMSGSGATCFGLFADARSAEAAARAILRDHPGWWVRDTCLDGHRLAAPQVMRSTT